jgi:Domain of unknown function (DUF932)
VKSGRSLSALAAEIERQAETKRDFKAPTDKIQIVPTTTPNAPPDIKLEMKTNGYVEQFGITNLAHEQLAQHIGIPQKYYDRMKAEAPDLLATNANHWLHEKPQTRLVRTLDGNARAFLSNRYRTIDNQEVAQAVLPLLLQQGRGLQISSAEITEKRLYIKVVNPAMQATLKLGQIVQSGISISNSEVGLHAYRIDPFVFILACLNGAQIPAAGLRKYHVGRQSQDVDSAYEVFADDTREADDRALMLKMRDMVGAAFDQVRFQETTRMLNVSIDHKIERGVDEVVSDVQEMFALPKALHSNILNELVKAGDLSQWGLSNAITALANTTDDYEDATTLERVGGEVLVLDQKQWKELAA